MSSGAPIASSSMLYGVAKCVVRGDTCRNSMQPNRCVVCDTHMSDEAIWRKHSDELVRYATVLVGPSDAEDLVSAVVVRVLASGTSLGDLDDARPYLYRAVLNEAKNLRRSRGRSTPYAVEAVPPPEMRPEVVGAVMALPPQQRAAVYLVYWRDHSVGAASKLMGCSPGSVKRYLFLARARLRRRLSDDA